MELPKTVKVGWKTFRIESWDPVASATAQRYGECDHTAKVIRIDTSHGDEQTVETLLHELLHAAITVGSLNPGLVAQGEFTTTEERIVDYFGSWITTILFDNQEVAEFIVRSLRRPST